MRSQSPQIAQSGGGARFSFAFSFPTLQFLVEGDDSRRVEGLESLRLSIRSYVIDSIVDKGYSLLISVIERLPV